MTFTRLELTMLVLALANVGVMLELVRRRRLKEKYALLWLAVGVLGILLSLLRGAVDAVANAVGIAYGPTVVFLGALLFLLFVCVQLSLELSRVAERTTLLAQEVSLLRHAALPEKRLDP